VNALPREVHRVSKWRFSTFISHKNTAPAEPGTFRSFRNILLDILMASSDAKGLFADF